MNITLTLFTVVLFILLTPGTFVRLPSNGNKCTVLFVHGLIFALVFYFSQRFIRILSTNIEGFGGPQRYRDTSCTVKDPKGKYIYADRYGMGYRCYFSK